MIAAIRIPTPEEIKARRARLGFGPANVNRKPKPAPVVNVVDEKPEWKAFVSAFDDHVIRHRANVGTKWYAKYARLRAVQLGFESFDSLLNDSRKRHFVLARQIIAYEIRNNKEHDTVSLPELGRFLNGADHTTVLHGERRVAKMGHENAINTLSKLLRDLTVVKRTVAKKLTDADVIAIREMYGTKSRVEICDIFDISFDTIEASSTGIRGSTCYESPIRGHGYLGRVRHSTDTQACRA